MRVNGFISTIYGDDQQLTFCDCHHRLTAGVQYLSTTVLARPPTYTHYTVENHMNQSDNKNEAYNMQDDLQNQVIDLQMSLTHLEVTVERLDEVIARQDKDIQTLQRQLQLIYKQIEGQDTDNGIAPFDVMADRPPHY